MAEDALYQYEFETLARALFIAADDAFREEVMHPDRLESELDDNPGMNEEEYKAYWMQMRIDEWIGRGLENVD